MAAGGQAHKLGGGCELPRAFHTSPCSALPQGFRCSVSLLRTTSCRCLYPPLKLALSGTESIRGSSPTLLGLLSPHFPLDSLQSWAPALSPTGLLAPELVSFWEIFTCHGNREQILSLFCPSFHSSPGKPGLV